MNKKFLCLLLVLLCCASCGKKEKDPEPFIPVSYETADIIERNESITGTFTDTSLWAEDYCLNAYPDLDVVTCEFSDGFVSPDTYMTDGYLCGASTFLLTLSSGEAVSVQVIYVEQGRTLTLCGVFENENIITSRPFVYAFVAQDPRFEKLCTSFPDINDGLFDNVLDLGVNNTEAAGILDGDTLLAVEAVSYGYGKNPPLTRLHFYSLSSKKEIKTEEIKDYYYHDTVLKDGFASVRLREKASSPEPSLEYRAYALKAGEIFKLKDPSVYELSDAVTVVSNDDGISVNGELCLPKSGSDAEIELPYFVCSVDDRRFIYCNGAWEWTWSVSLYDTETKESTELFGENFLPIGVFGDKLYIMEEGEELCGGLWSLDLSSLEKQNVLAARTDTASTDASYFVISPDGKLLSAIRSKESGRRYETLEIYSLSSGSLLSQKPLDVRAGYSKKLLFLDNKPALLFHLYETDSDVLMW